MQIIRLADCNIVAANHGNPRLVDIRIDGSYNDELMPLDMDETVVDIEGEQTKEKKGGSKEVEVEVGMEVEVEVKEEVDAPLLNSLSGLMEETLEIRTNHTISMLKIMVFATRHIRAPAARKEGKGKYKRKKDENVIDKKNFDMNKRGEKSCKNQDRNEVIDESKLEDKSDDEGVHNDKEKSNTLYGKNKYKSNRKDHRKPFDSDHAENFIQIVAIVDNKGTKNAKTSLNYV